MSVLYIALPIAVLLGAAAVVACIKCIGSGQYDDLETPSVRMLIDEKPINQDLNRRSDRKPNGSTAGSHSSRDAVDGQTR